jgi:hypothetical protein
MGLADELWKLQEMHQRGELSDDEYTQAKAAVLSGTTPGEGEQLDELSRQLDEVSRRQEVADIDRSWEREREHYMAAGTSGGTHDAHGRYVGGTPYRYIPTRGGSIGVGIFTAVGGLLWIIFTASLGGGAFALFGLVFIAFGIGTAVYNYNKAVNYEQAYSAYLERRSEALEGHGRPSQAEPQERRWDEQPPDIRGEH